ncbi:RNA polymerase sigma-70 factor (ECF subfamily) [Pedobacter cryoconitis]|uniref:RNA polymerase sigma-70 factor (ECF subfamily) n=1 Tax=Pedobacter cryoconitis TaxID=188932 RepID=A0A7W9DJP9_9SPHI|nr:RNA polymerase sigma-70 factor [Pedobacter cryoconitis]MBB5621441.1 RNA polymerase sigma-70 factor (ECF subfamily) [Pedobacter cryoconitis]MBB5643781.1 RNA polymerase sigma-70 factor (ECF subfamily) [Pedobacter cryoconitis]
MSEEQKYSLPDEEQALIAALKMHDRKAFEKLYKEHYRRLFALAYRYVGQAPVAEEIVHDVFLTIWKIGGALKVQYSIKSYLSRAVINSSLNFIKKEKINNGKQHAFLVVESDPDIENEQRAKKESLLNSLEDAMAILPPKCREVMYLSRFGKLKQQEIATQMNISIKTVKNHLTYGFQKLRELLEKQQQNLLLLLLILYKY